MANHQPANWEVFCVLFNENIPFSVKIQPDATVGELKDAIKTNKQPEFDGFGANRLTLYLVNLPDDDNLAKNVKQQWPLKALRATQLVNALFLGAPATQELEAVPAGPQNGMVNIVVQRPTIAPRHQAPNGSKRKASLETPLDSVVAAKRLRVIDDPISDCNPSLFAQTLYTRLHQSRFALNRPSLPETLPLAILDPIFGSFIDETDTHIPTAADNALVLELRKAMSTVCDDEWTFCYEFRNIVARHYPDVQFLASRIGSSNYTSRGHLSVGEFIPAVCQGRLWNGYGDPEVQASGYYVASLRQSFPRGDHPDRLPCIILYFVGPIICFAGAVLTDHLQLETLVSPLAMHTNIHEDKVSNQAARTFGAFRHAVQKLSSHYRKLAASRPPRSIPTADMERLVFPYQSSFTNREGKQIDFTYVERLFEDKLLFIGTAYDELDILIKFTRRYSEDAHRLCAEKNVAPKLYAVERLAGGWMMVVMKYLDPNVYKAPFPSPLDPKPLLKKIEEAVRILHGGGFVHGDVRAPNVMANADASQVMLIDFDWAGLEGEVRYPPNINTNTIPIGVTDGQIIEKRHDLEMLDYIFRISPLLWR